MVEPLLDVRGLKTYFDTQRGPVKAVDGVSYNVMPGEIVGLVGESGCGKTVSALSLLRLIPEPPGKVWAGEAIFEGKDLLKMNAKEMRHVRGLMISVVFQEPMTSLNPVFPIGRQITETMIEHKVVEKAKAEAEALRLLELVGIPDAHRLKQYPGEFSGGMRQRVMLAMALSCNPRLIIADEPTTAVDVTIQAQILELLASIVQRFNAAILLITHNLGMVAKYANRVNVMYAGRIVEQATCEELFANPKHPYTRMLLMCSPRLDRDRQTKLIPIQGQPPDLVRRPRGCPFHPRCYCVKDDCKKEWPPLIEATKDHTVAFPFGDGV